MKKEKTVKTYQRRTKSGKVVTVRQHTARYDAAEAMKEAAKKKGAGSELVRKKKASVEENPLGFSAEDYKEWYHWDMEDDANNEAALRVEKALQKKMGKKAYNKYLDDMTDSYSARGHKKAHETLLAEHTERQKKQDTEISKAAKDIARGAKEKAAVAKATKAETSVKPADKSKSKKFTIKDYQSMSDEELSKTLSSLETSPSKYLIDADNAAEKFYRDKTNGRDTTKSKAQLDKAKRELKDWYSTPEGKAYKTATAQRKQIRDEINRRKEAELKTAEKSAKKALGGLVSGTTWQYNSSDGSFKTSHSTAWGKPDSSRVEKLLQKAEAAGWKKADHSSSMQPDDSNYRETTRLVSPDGGYELTYHYSAGDFSPNKHYVTIRKTK